MTTPAAGLGTYAVLLVLVLTVGVALAFAVRSARRSGPTPPIAPPDVWPTAPPEVPDPGRPAVVVLVVSTLRDLAPRPTPPPVHEDEVIAFGRELETTDDVVGGMIRESSAEPES